MKQKLIAMLKTLFASKGFSQKAIEGLADYLAPNLTEESTDAELTAAIEGITPMTTLMQSEINRQVNEAKPKPKPEEKPTVPVETPKPDEAPSSTDTVILAMLTEIKNLSQGLAAINGQTVANTRRDQFIKAMEGTPAAYQAKELKRFDRITFKDDEDFTSFLEDTKDDHAYAVQEESNSGLGGDRPAGGTGGGNAAGKKEATAAEVDAAVDSIL